MPSIDQQVWQHYYQAYRCYGFSIEEAAQRALKNVDPAATLAKGKYGWVAVLRDSSCLSGSPVEAASSVVSDTFKGTTA